MSPRTTPQRWQILLVDDNAADIELATQCFLETGVPCDVNGVQNGEAALAYLSKQPPHQQAPRPDIILLDLNLPGADGRDILRIIKSHPDFHTIPVIVLTTSDSDSDVNASFRLHANAYHRKPLDLHEFMRLAAVICDYWFRWSSLPIAR